jgi:L-ribulose-5-phosphate 4-epimerase
LIGGEEIGKEVIEHIGESSALLLKNHGVFTIGNSAKSAVKSAVMVEDVAATVWMALQIGTPEVIAPENVEKLHYRYTHVYGQ